MQEAHGAGTDNAAATNGIYPNPGNLVQPTLHLKITDAARPDFAAAAREIAEAAQPLVTGGCYVMPAEGDRRMLDLYQDVVRLRYAANLILFLFHEPPVGEINVPRDDRPSCEKAVAKLREKACEFGNKYTHAAFDSEWLTRDLAALTAAASRFEQFCEKQESAAVPTKTAALAVA